LAFGERIASLHAEPVRGHRRAIIGTGSGNPVTMLRVDRDTRRPPTLSGQIAVARAVLLAVNGCSWGGTRLTAARRIFAEVPCRWHGCRRPGDADEPVGFQNSATASDLVFYAA